MTSPRHKNPLPAKAGSTKRNAMKSAAVTRDRKRWAIACHRVEASQRNMRRCG